MKIDRHGRAKIPKQRFSASAEGIYWRRCGTVPCSLSACIQPAASTNVTLQTRDVYDSRSRVRPEIIIRKGQHQGKLATRTIPVIEDLRIRLQEYHPPQPRDSVSGRTKRASPSRILPASARGVPAGWHRRGEYPFLPARRWTQMSNAGFR